MPRSVLLSCEEVGKAYGTRRLFEGLSLGLLDGDRAGLVGPNGSGKSTLLKILAGLETPDTGTRSLRTGVRVGYVPQDPEFASARTVEEVVLEALTDVEADDRPGRVAQTLARAGLTDGRAAVDALSAGGRKRLAIARALAAEPDVLLMDEPTNHLDVDGIFWLEDVLRQRARAFLVVSHDRWFLEHVATRMLELSRVYPDGVFAVDGRYSDFLARRDDFLRGQAAWEESLANTVRREIEWLRRGAKARSTKARGRIKQADRLIEDLEAARGRAATSTAGIEFTASSRRTRKLLVARGIAKRVGDRTLFDGLDLTIAPGTCVGVIGPNASGKTTLLHVLAGTLAADAGDIERAAGLRVVSFDRAGDALDPDVSLRRTLAPEGDTLTVAGRGVHVAAWAKRFLFTPEQLDVPARRLSGGERARVHIARLVREPADVLVLDEPTNDLDIPTLEVLEESLGEFPGGVVLVTHDRFMLERVATLIVALDGHGGAQTFADYAQWEAARTVSAAPAPRPAERVRAPRAPAPRRLAYHEQREWDGMERAILEAEAALAACRRAADDPAIASDAAALQERYAALDAARERVERLYSRWAELEAKQT